jgi:hypothetical protein
MARFKEYADVYRSFDEFNPGTKEALFFYRLEQLDTTTIYPVLLETIKRFDNPDGRTELHEILGDIESFFVRRAVCELTGKNYNKLTVELLRELDKTQEFSARAIRGFLQRQETEVGRWPDDEEFRKAWMEIDFYKRLKRSRGRMILEALEAALHTGKSEKVQVEKRLTIEHLLPREWEDHWPLPGREEEADKNARARNGVLHKVGNLTLLTRRLNPSVSNSAWEKKRKDILRHSALNLNRELPDVWNEEAIGTRSEELFKIAVKVWPRP